MRAKKGVFTGHLFRGMVLMLRRSVPVSLFISANPTLNDNERKKVISTLVPEGSSSIMTNLFTVLAANGRLSLFPHIVSDFSTLMSAHNGQLIVTVTSAEPLAAGGKEMQRLEKALKGSKVAQGKTLKLVNKVNPAVLGGLQVDFGDQTIDLSASSKVTKFSAALGGGCRQFDRPHDSAYVDESQFPHRVRISESRTGEGRGFRNESTSGEARKILQRMCITMTCMPLDSFRVIRFMVVKWIAYNRIPPA